MTPRRSTTRPTPRDRPATPPRGSPRPGPAPEPPLEPDAPATLSVAASRDARRLFHGALGITDPVELELTVVANTFSWELKAYAETLREDARLELPETATPAEVDAEAIRILHEMFGLVPSPWASPDGPEPPAAGVP